MKEAEELHCVDTDLQAVASYSGQIIGMLSRIGIQLLMIKKRRISFLFDDTSGHQVHWLVHLQQTVQWCLLKCALKTFRIIIQISESG